MQLQQASNAANKLRSLGKQATSQPTVPTYRFLSPGEMETGEAVGWAGVK